MIPAIENNSCGLVPPPSPSDLILLFERFMAYWRGAVVHLTGLEEGLFSPESPEFTVQWGRAPQSRLSLRFDPSFYPWLMSRRDFKQLNLSTESELLKEITALYALYLIRFSSMADLMEAGPLTPRRPLAGEMVSRAPDSQVLLKVEGHLVEIKLWGRLNNQGGN